MPKKIEHVICLMLENRSFDHMLGFLPHANESYAGLRSGSYSEAGVRPSPTAAFEIPVSPPHTNASVLKQIGPRPDGPTAFMEAYEAHFGRKPGDRQDVMRAFHPEMVPVLSTLAAQFAVCDHWFCSVPGGTFPNRDFAVTGTSFGYGENPRGVRGLRSLIRDHRGAKTIFQQLLDHGRSYAIYRHQASAMMLLYPHLNDDARPGKRFGKFDDLKRDIIKDDLHDFSWVEPDFGVIGRGNSQHPGQADSMAEFIAGEALIADLYTTLRKKRSVFEKTLLLITYDEHGGFYDHVRPPYQGDGSEAGERAVPPDGRRLPNFAFDQFGVRVPMVMISPYIDAGTLDPRVYDHSSIAATVRSLFGAGSLALTMRDQRALTFESVLNRSTPRGPRELPEVRALGARYEAHEVQQRHAVEGRRPRREHADGGLADDLVAAASAARMEREQPDGDLDDDSPVPAGDVDAVLESILAGVAPRTVEVRGPDGSVVDIATRDGLDGLLRDLQHAPAGDRLRMRAPDGSTLQVASDGSIELRREQSGEWLQGQQGDSQELLQRLDAFRSGDMHGATTGLKPV